MSVPAVPTVNPLAMTVPAESVISAAAAVPVLAAKPSVSGTPEKVRTPADIVPHGLDSVIVDSVAAMPVVPISNLPEPDPASIALRTTVRRLLMTLVL